MQVMKNKNKGVSVFASAPDWESGTDYPKDCLVMNDGICYKCKVANQDEVFDYTKWVEITPPSPDVIAEMAMPSDVYDNIGWTKDNLTGNSLGNSFVYTVPENGYILVHINGGSYANIQIRTNSRKICAYSIPNMDNIFLVTVRKGEQVYLRGYYIKEVYETYFYYSVGSAKALGLI